KQANPDREMAALQLGRLVAGTPPTDPMFQPQPWQNLGIHLEVFRQFMASPRFLRQPPQIQEALVQHLMRLHQLASQQAMQGAMAAQGMAPPPIPGTSGTLGGPGTQPQGAPPPMPPPGMAPPPAQDPSHRP